MNKKGSLPALAILALVVILGIIALSMFFTANPEEKETLMEIVGAVKGDSSESENLENPIINDSYEESNLTSSAFKNSIVKCSVPPLDSRRPGHFYITQDIGFSLIGNISVLSFPSSHIWKEFSPVIL